MADHMESAEAAREWREYAERDLRSAEYLLGCRPLPVEVIAFLCQQAAEKALKGILAFHNVDPPSIHNLVELHRLCKTFLPTIDLLAQCKALNKYSVSARYPNQLDVTEAAMHKALADTKAVMEAARPLFGDR
jgi:HEPN domain-containing protein